MHARLNLKSIVLLLGFAAPSARAYTTQLGLKDSCFALWKKLTLQTNFLNRSARYRSFIDVRLAGDYTHLHASLDIDETLALQTYASTPNQSIIDSILRRRAGLKPLSPSRAKVAFEYDHLFHTISTLQSLFRHPEARLRREVRAWAAVPAENFSSEGLIFNPTFTLAHTSYETAWAMITQYRLANHYRLVELRLTEGTPALYFYHEASTVSHILLPEASRFEITAAPTRRHAYTLAGYP